MLLNLAIEDKLQELTKTGAGIEIDVKINILNFAENVEVKFENRRGKVLVT